MYFKVQAFFFVGLGVVVVGYVYCHDQHTPPPPPPLLRLESPGGKFSKSSGGLEYCKTPRSTKMLFQCINVARTPYHGSVLQRQQ